MTTKPQVLYSEYKDITYREAWDIQTDLHNEMKSQKLSWRNLPKEDKLKQRQTHQLLFCEHDHVYTLGKSGTKDNLLLSDDELKIGNIEYYKINRGGDITYHGPGQITGYPILDMDEFYTDIHKYVRMLEECIIQLLREYGVDGTRIPEFTGVWIKSETEGQPHRKICAIGVHLSRWITMHGFALNVNTDLSYFNNIIPCGINDEDKTVTSLEKELGRKIDLGEVKAKLKSIFAILFDFEYVE